MPMWLLHAGTVAAEQEDPDASYRLAYMYKVGRGGLQQDDTTAASLERVSAEQVCAISAFLPRSIGECSDRARMVLQVHRAVCGLRFTAACVVSMLLVVFAARAMFMP